MIILFYFTVIFILSIFYFCFIFYLLFFTLFCRVHYPYRQAGEYEQCQQQCQKVISADLSNEQATIMLSEVLSLAPTPDPEAAVRPLLLLLKEHPNSYKGGCVRLSVLSVLTITYLFFDTSVPLIILTSLFPLILPSFYSYLRTPSNFCLLIVYFLTFCVCSSLQHD